MATLALILLPWIVSILAFGLVEWQWKEPLLYPWPLLVPIALHIFAAVMIGMRRLPWKEMLEKMGPSALAMMSMAFAFLLIEGTVMHLILGVLFAGISLLTLKLFFFLCFDAARYPVNAISRVNLALMPLTAFFLAWGMAGLTVFMRLPWYATLPVFAGVCALFYYWTAHPTATASTRWQWAAIGAFIGLQVGILVQLLPISMEVQGVVAAFMTALPLRVRRYGYQPRPSHRVAWVEGGLAVTAYVGALIFARWA
ncbi:MAG: hypothetical protein WCV84_03785 [Patescibacteria group bacterium]